MKPFLKPTLAILLSLNLAACQSDENAFDLLETVTAGASGPCTIDSSTPLASSTSIRIPASASAPRSTFSVQPGGTGCKVSFYLNDVLITSTGSTLSLDPALLASGTNTLKAIAANSDGSGSVSWTISKNRPPICTSQYPAATGNSTGIAVPLTLISTGGDLDGDSLTFSWSSNGSAANSAQFAVTNPSVLSSQAIFTPTSAYTGPNTILANIFDGYDTTSCTWTVSVASSCAVSSSLPATSTTKVPYSGVASSSFGVVPNNSACAISWKLNGTTIAGTGSFQTLTSSQFNAGDNTLTATLFDGVSSATRSWTINRNSAPTCASQTPASGGNTGAYGQSKTFYAARADADAADTSVTFAWKIDGVYSSALFPTISSTATTSSANLVPSLAQVGTGHTVTSEFSDGYDTGTCTWSLDVTDPNGLAVTSCQPGGAPVTVGSTIVVQSSGAQSSKTFTVSATGTGVTYAWKKDGTTVSGATSADLTLSAGSLAVGNYALVANATDTYGNTSPCTWNVKRNDPPALSTVTPANGAVIKMNVGSTLNFSVTGSDANNDTIIYSWKLDSASSGTLPSGSGNGLPNTTFTPGGNTALLGSHVITVTATDGDESTSVNWNIEVNQFSNDCNTLYNGVPVATGAGGEVVTGGKICTLVGTPGVGDLVDPTADQTKVRVQPSYSIDDGAGNIILSDIISHSVMFYNRSGSSITRWGKIIPAGKLVVIVGNGANGLSAEGNTNNSYKLSSPLDLAYDSSNNYLYISDYTNARVVRLDSNGVANVVIGGASNNTAGNTDNNPGTSHNCTNPTGLRLVSYGGAKWLYVACYSSHSIKRMNADTNDANYGKTSVVVGATTSGATAAAPRDGTTGLTGTATVNGPWALSDDGQGNIYFLEYGGYRVRMAAMGGNAMQFYGGARSKAQAVTVSVADLSGSPLTAITGAISADSGSTAVTKLGLFGTTKVVTSECVPYQVTLLNATTEATPAAADTIVSLSASVGSLYSNSACSVALGASVTISTGEAEKKFYLSRGTAGATTLTATATSLTTATLAVTAAALSTESKLALSLPASYLYSGCAPLNIQVLNSAGTARAPSSINRTLRVTHNGIGNFFADSSCSGAPSSTFTLASGASNLLVYYASSAIVNANEVVTLAGTNASNTISPTVAGSPIDWGLVTVRNPRGLAVLTSGADVTGFFIANWDHHRVMFINNSASTQTFGGQAIAPKTADLVLGTGTANYNGDGLGITSRIYDPYGISISADKHTLFVADYLNYRLRGLDISTGAGNVTTLLGAGRARAGFISDSGSPAPEVYLNAPAEILIERTARKLYYSDGGNDRIRRLDLLTGSVDTLLGRGAGVPTVENEDPLNVYTQGPRGLAFYTKGANSFLLYADQQATTGINTASLVRAFNLSGSSTTLFGASVQAGKVSTIVGDYSKGSNTWATAPANVDGDPGTSVRLYNPEGIASDGTNLYIANYNDHCILKVAPNGASSSVTRSIGTCGSSGTTDGASGVALLTNPTQIYMDPDTTQATFGNFFVVDQAVATTGRVRYVNFNPAAGVTIGGVSVGAAPSAGNYTVKTLWTVTPYGSSARLWGIAAFGSRQICYAGGLLADGNTGTHNVTCRDRASGVGSVSLRVGSDEQNTDTVRGGGPLGNEQEGQPASSVTVSAPFGLDFDSAGNLYISDRNNHIIRMVRKWW